ncbi:hypothetical protein B5X24_HaOG215994 [Helicoverpa armigera]|nr:hypothetical protein B5X24_HaOG215994 [Helicoverpa armigera]
MVSCEVGTRPRRGGGAGASPLAASRPRPLADATHRHTKGNPAMHKSLSGVGRKTWQYFLKKMQMELIYIFVGN